MSTQPDRHSAVAPSPDVYAMTVASGRARLTAANSSRVAAVQEWLSAGSGPALTPYGPRRVYSIGPQNPSRRWITSSAQASASAAHWAARKLPNDVPAGMPVGNAAYR